MSFTLKHIPCPAGDKCTAFRCIFGHANEQKGPADEGESSGEHDHSFRQGRKVKANEPPPQKRLKTDAAEPLTFDKQKETVSRTLDVANSEADVPANPEVLTCSLHENLLPARPAISHPPVRRSKESSMADLPPSVPAAKKADPIASASHKKVHARPKKRESLNPRLLRSSPASHEIRLKLLKLVHHELVRLNSELKTNVTKEENDLLYSEQELACLALDEEETIANEKGSVYPNIMKNRIMQYKRMSVSQWKLERMARKRAESQQPQDMDASSSAVKVETGLSPALEVQILLRLLTPVDKLAQHGYVTDVPSTESVIKAKEGIEACHGWEKCDRCQQRFQVFPGRREEDGVLTSGGPCKFHWGKTYLPPKPPGDTARVPKRYRCCGEEVGDTSGCFAQDHHVFKAPDPKRLATTLNFALTPDNPTAPKDRALCFDCEMAYTTNGIELIRLTATSWPTGDLLLDILVQPFGEILDLNSRFSGIWPDDMAQALPWSEQDEPNSSKKRDHTDLDDGEVRERREKLKIVSSPLVARNLFFSLISPSTPLVGHGLENDLNAIRVIHPTLVDTVILYPHKAGLPYRNSLKMLMDVHLNRKIQQETGSKVIGHDSAEDARAAGELAHLKVMQEWKDMQWMGWTVMDEKLVSPNGHDIRSNGALTEKFIES